MEEEPASTNQVFWIRLLPQPTGYGSVRRDEIIVREPGKGSIAIVQVRHNEGLKGNICFGNEDEVADLRST